MGCIHVYSCFSPGLSLLHSISAAVAHVVLKKLCWPLYLIFLHVSCSAVISLSYGTAIKSQFKGTGC